MKMCLPTGATIHMISARKVFFVKEKNDRARKSKEKESMYVWSASVCGTICNTACMHLFAMQEQEDSEHLVSSRTKKSHGHTHTHTHLMTYVKPFIYFSVLVGCCCCEGNPARAKSLRYLRRLLPTQTYRGKTKQRVISHPSRKRERRSPFQPLPRPQPQSQRSCGVSGFQARDVMSVLAPDDGF